jgi:hypothetical protein
MHRQSKRWNRHSAPIGIQAIGLANPPRRFTQDETFQMAGYTSPRILNIFRNCDIDFRRRNSISNRLQLFQANPVGRRDMQLIDKKFSGSLIAVSRVKKADDQGFEP